MIGNTSSKATGCGCGGGGTLSISQCSCGGAGCGSCHAQGVVRPRFFAGQLLTEDDLQLLTDYVGQKNRLHNRHLFGSGVVCGLEVSCHPCRDGRVIVHPGYALDCCGNDLTLSCAQTLDINSMVRDLRLAGFDCVDPCPEPPKNGKPKDPPNTTGTGEGGTDEPKEKPKVDYCLYIRYCEQPSDPVAPYSTGEDCVQVGCEATRIQEGVKFELRCSPSHSAANPLIQRLCACLGDLDKLPLLLRAADRLRQAGRALSYAKKRETEPFSSDQIPTLKTKTTELVNLTGGRLDTVDTTRARTFDPGALTEDPKVVEKRLELNDQFITNFRDVAVIVNRFDQLPVERQNEFLRADQQLEATLIQSRAATRFTLNQAMTQANSPFNIVRDWLIERLNKSPFITDCTLNQRVYELTLPRKTENQSLTEFSVAAENSNDLFEALVDYVRDCICRALNPACLPCEDSAVLLACLDVQECQVKNICNMERTFVLSPAAVRYWLPPLQLLGNLLERACCEPLTAIPTKGNSQEPDFGLILREEVVRIIKDSLCDVSDQTLDRLFGEIGSFGKRGAINKITTGSVGERINAADLPNRPSTGETVAQPAAAETTATAPAAPPAPAPAPPAPSFQRAAVEETSSEVSTARTDETSSRKSVGLPKRNTARTTTRGATKNGKTTEEQPTTPSAETETPPPSTEEPSKGDNK